MSYSLHRKPIIVNSGIFGHTGLVVIANIVNGPVSNLS